VHGRDALLTESGDRFRTGAPDPTDNCWLHS
jgi:hypothetical protein